MVGQPLSPVPIDLDDGLRRVFGAPTDSIADIEARARLAFPDRSAVVWEGDPATFEFSYVSPSARDLLGHPVERWTGEASFWADRVVHRDDRSNAIAYCALATAKGRDHVFEYRAVTHDGAVVWLRDIVKVIVGAKGVPVLLRGIMFDVTAEKLDDGELARPREPSPPHHELVAL